ncbi:MAG: flagellar hook capping FlgD N-terminal domain-containing protein [Rhodospirillaceae bacterium]|nr:flagellar hook capping FlgD N-terminal domain-containing protein [Rhodospirillaceae bacterium]
MDITALTGSSGTDVLSKSDASRNKLAKDLDSFLMLLTSQLKNQDPLSPMDSTEFTNQLVQFAQVEQSINSNESLTSLISLSQQNIVTNSVNYIGKTVEANSKQVPLQNGQAKLGYGVTADAHSVTIIIRDAAGKIVHTEQGEKKAGVHPLTWNGKDGSGKQLPDGAYSVEVTAITKDNEPIETYSTAFGKVTGVTTKDGQTLLVMDKLGVGLDKILSITA